MTLTGTAVIVTALMITGLLLLPFVGSGGSPARVKGAVAIALITGAYVVRRSVPERALDGPTRELRDRSKRRRHAIEGMSTSSVPGQ